MVCTLPRITPTQDPRLSLQLGCEVTIEVDHIRRDLPDLYSRYVGNLRQDFRADGLREFAPRDRPAVGAAFLRAAHASRAQPVMNTRVVDDGMILRAVFSIHPDLVVKWVP